jgi:exopolyphosphatase/guanosine-5'-triphosphate,3'-diphosphate pyrophosphatase
MIDQMIGASGDRPYDRDTAIERLAADCGCEMAHSRHVARLAGSIYAQLAEGYELNPNDRELLETAARLQDVGYLINYDQHHKHSYHLILHSRLETFKPNELELIANVARYHRGADPKQKHANFRQLSARDQARVRQMAAVLRVAGGLDRSNTQQATDVRVVFQRDGNIELRLTAKQFPEVDIWAARKRAKLFEKVFDVELDVAWEESQQDVPAATDGANGQSLLQATPQDSGAKASAAGRRPR